MNKLEFLEKVKNIEIDYCDIEECYYKIYNLYLDYAYETNDYSNDYLFEEFCTYDVIEELACQELEANGLRGLYWFLGSANLGGSNELFKIDGYGQVVDVEINDIECLKDELIYNLKEED